ncbi:hypothetical protein [Halothermothrix orenii]|uniref:Uncharacterized protein n=1 Tax=Halothermothrix orenii (strain H 168 / OCM 544 / DSM 9562) TaxID=373903 RepID=B8D254_HALOH|nr:hypothetical protein [Halothermothrix orenii]ACL69281.1 hypothetical protein Hore_05230 [Halothermothrix orenii H 168]
MENTSLDFRPEITPKKINKLKETAGELKTGEHISIILERTDAHQAKNILKILEENNIDYQTKGGHEDEFFITGKKQ